MNPYKIMLVDDEEEVRTSIIRKIDWQDAGFEVIDIGRRQNMDWVELIPRDAESQFVRVLLAFFNGDLLRMEMADKFGQVTRFQFLDIKHNPTFKSTFFQFVPPRDVDIYNR